MKKAEIKAKIKYKSFVPPIKPTPPPKPKRCESCKYCERIQERTWHNYGGATETETYIGSRRCSKHGITVNKVGGCPDYAEGEGATIRAKRRVNAPVKPPANNPGKLIKLAESDAGWCRVCKSGMTWRKDSPPIDGICGRRECAEEIGRQRNIPPIEVLILGGICRENPELQTLIKKEAAATAAPLLKPNAHKKLSGLD